MLPAHPPDITNGDFDPATYPINGDEDGMDVDDQEESTVDLSSTEINILIYLYLLESNLSHTAFSLLSESRLHDTSLFQYFNPSYGTSSSSKAKANGTPGIGKSPRDGLFGRAEGKIPRGELIRKLWKALRWEEIERHVTASGEPYQPACRNPFHLIVPHICPPGYPSATKNPKTPLPPSFRVSPPPSRLEEAFPPDDQEMEEDAVAGPSASREKERPTAGKGKRKTRRQSNESSSRQASPARATSPLPKDRRREKEKKRAKTDRDIIERPSSRASKGKEKADSPVDPEPRRKLTTNGLKTSSSKGSKLSVDERDVEDKRTKSPLVQPQEVEADEEEEEEEEVEEVEEKEDRKTRDAREKRDKDLERRSRTTWIGDHNVTILWDHRDSVTDVAWNPKNREVLASASNDGTARLWDFKSQEDGQTGALEQARQSTVIAHKSIESNKKAVTHVSWHPEGTVLATASHDGTGRLFTPSGQLQGIMNYGRGAISALKFSPSGARILTAKTDYTVTLWSIGRSHEQRMVQNFSSHSAEVNDVEWLDEQVFASCGNDKKIFVYRTNDKVSRFTFGHHTDDITKLAWQPPQDGLAPENRKLASASDDGTVRLWLLPRYPKDRGTVSRSVSPNKSQRDEDDGEEEYEFEDSKNKRRCVGVLQVVKESENKRMDTIAWSPDGKYLAAGGQETTVMVFDTDTCELHFSLWGLEEGTGSIAFSPATKGLLAGGGWNGRICIYDYKTGEVKAQYEYDEPVGKQRIRDKPMNLAMEWRHDGNQLAVALANKSLVVLSTGQLSRTAVTM